MVMDELIQSLHRADKLSADILRSGLFATSYNDEPVLAVAENSNPFNVLILLGCSAL